MKTAQKKPEIKPYRRGEDCLDDLQALTVRLESGQIRTFSIPQELAYPTDEDEILEAHRKAPASAAFWDYQTERALYDVRLYETGLEKLEGDARVVKRNALESICDSFVAESAVEAAVASDDYVYKQRNQLNDLRRQYGLLRSVRDAMVRRVSVLNRMADQIAQRYSGPSGTRR